MYEINNQKSEARVTDKKAEETHHEETVMSNVQYVYALLNIEMYRVRR